MYPFVSKPFTIFCKRLPTDGASIELFTSVYPFVSEPFPIFYKSLPTDGASIAVFVDMCSLVTDIESLLPLI